MSVPNLGSSSKSARKFTDAQAKFIAEFFVRHYDILTRAQGGFHDNVNKQRGQLHQELTNQLNARWGKQFTTREVWRKLKNLKQDAKDLLQEMDNGLRSLNGEDEPDIPQMDEAESVIVQKMLSVRNSSSGVYRGQSPNLDGLIQVPSPNQHDDDDDDVMADEDFLAAQSVQQEFGQETEQIHGSQRPIPATPRLQPTVQPRGLATLTPIRNEKARPTPAAAQKSVPQKRKFPTMTQATGTTSGDTAYKALKRNVLLLHRRVLEGELEMQEQKKMALIKFNAALDEFRRYVAEQRMISRGVDVSNIPVDIPPGMQGIGIE